VKNRENFEVEEELKGMSFKFIGFMDWVIERVLKLKKNLLELKNISMNLRVELWRDPLIESIG